MFQFTRPQGARLACRSAWRSGSCFNSRARKGRDREEACRAGETQGFNSRARKGRDMADPHGPITSCVSIHAPARGATKAGCVMSCCALFQFTRPQGARPLRRSPRYSVLRFNSRARKGRDAVERQLVRVHQFQFTRPQGARPRIRQDARAVKHVSIHAPARGATSPRQTRRNPLRFQFTRPQGARRLVA